MSAPRVPHDAGTRSKALDLYADGWPASRVAAHLGIGKTTVVNWAADAGITRPNGVTRRLTTDAELAFDGAWVRDGLVWRPVPAVRKAS